MRFKRVHTLVQVTIELERRKDVYLYYLSLSKLLYVTAK